MPASSLNRTRDDATPNTDSNSDDATNPCSPNSHGDNTNLPDWLSQVAFNDDGLIPAIAQDKQSGTILMMAWMNAEALQHTVQTQTAVYYSRSRRKLWHKGETSGHTQLVHDIYLDCDADALVLSVTQIGSIACHTGRQSCFYQRLDIPVDIPDTSSLDSSIDSDNPTPTPAPKWQVVAPVLKDPQEIYHTTSAPSNGILSASVDTPYGSTNTLETVDSTVKPSDKADEKASEKDSGSVTAYNLLSQLDRVLNERKQANADSSYVSSLYAKGINKILEKVGEEAVETIIAAKDLASVTDANSTQSKATQNTSKQALVDDLVYEVADVWFHTLVMLAWFDLDSQLVLDELARRFGLSGIDEKNSRFS